MAAGKVYRKGANTAARVAAEFRRAIRQGELLPGEHVSQTQWAERMGVSSGPTREALKILETEQLVTYSEHHGYSVSRVNPHEIHQIYLLRRVLETELFRTMRWPSALEIAELRSLMDKTLALIADGDLPAAHETSRTVFFRLYDLSPLDLVVREVKRYFDMGGIYRSLLLGTLDDPQASNLSLLYERLTTCLAEGDREQLIHLNLEETSRIAQGLFAY